MSDYKCKSCKRMLNRVQNDIYGSLQYVCECGVTSPTITYVQDDIKEYYLIIDPWLADNAIKIEEQL